MCDFVTETCRLTISDLQTKKSVPGQLGVQSKFLTDDSMWMDVVATKVSMKRQNVNMSA